MKIVVTILLTLALVNSQILPGTTTCCEENQITVSGSGRASGQPDVAEVSIRLQEKGTTTAEAVQALSAKTSQTLAVLTQNQISNQDYETGSLNVFPEYSFLNGRNEVIGQTASQSLTVRVRNLDAKGESVARLIDALAAVNGININSVTFDILDKTQLQTEARAAAFNDAKQKAEDFASAAGVRVGRVLTIDDNSFVSSPPIEFANVARLSVAASDSVQTSIPVGELEVSYSTNVVFQLR